MEYFIIKTRNPPEWADFSRLLTNLIYKNQTINLHKTKRLPPGGGWREATEGECVHVEIIRTSRSARLLPPLRGPPPSRREAIFLSVLFILLMTNLISYFVSGLRADIESAPYKLFNSATDVQCTPLRFFNSVFTGGETPPLHQLSSIYLHAASAAIAPSDVAVLI